MSLRIDASLWETISNWFWMGDPRFQQIDEIHEARDTHARLISFEIAFQEFVVLLSEGQKYGITAGKQSKYEELKHQLAKSYLTLRPFLLAYIRFDVEDERLGLRTVGAGTDAFEAIWVASSLQSFVESDDVFFPDRVARANEAIRDYTEHLHRLLETRV